MQESRLLARQWLKDFALEVRGSVPREAPLQFTIESRPLTNGSGGPSTQMVIEASDPRGAISEFVRRSRSELVSFATPGMGRESIGTVKKEDSVFLVRVYEN